jgi:hypothetical protein
MTQISTTSRNDGFAIEVLDGSASAGAAALPAGAAGRIRVGEFTETFLMDLSFWTVADYRHSWHAALRKLEEAENSTSCLIASITDPAASNFVSCWPMYREGEEVHVQNSIIFLDELDEQFDAQEPWRFVAARSTLDEDANRISEWLTSAAQVRRFRGSAWG